MKSFPPELLQERVAAYFLTRARELRSRNTLDMIRACERTFEGAEAVMSIIQRALTTEKERLQRLVEPVEQFEALERTPGSFNDAELKVRSHRYIGETSFPRAGTYVQGDMVDWTQLPEGREIIIHELKQDIDSIASRQNQLATHEKTPEAFGKAILTLSRVLEQ